MVTLDNLAHRLAIAEQLGRYCLTFDSSDADGWAALFTDDGVFEVRLTGDDKPIFQARGFGQLRAFAANAPRLLHHVTGLVFDEMLPDSARTRATVLGTWASPEDGYPAIYTHGRYEHRWSLVAGTWRIAYQLFISRGYHAAAFPRRAQ
ncbi:nuclear transport factor 2 family protein [uncultured Piscinibacter sp.]|uniref:nuclear transport factor 2 family protein n=1 Tax=uncultured Piscinibacter sp. TaxID=1131835 RepID=UPI002602B6A2|nr:nuclear transport factor 2 family protein [uncultured Piscinibacter sp.]